MTVEELEQTAVQLIGPRERRLFLMNDAGVYWVRSDMTSEEADRAVDTLASWFYRGAKGLTDFADGPPFRLYDDGDVIPR